MIIFNLFLLIPLFFKLITCSRHVIITGSSNILVNGIYSCNDDIDNENVECKTYQLTNRKSFRIDIKNILGSDNSIVRHWYIISNESDDNNKKIYGALELNHKPLSLKTWKNLNSSQYESVMKLGYINLTNCDMNIDIKTEVDNNYYINISRSIWMSIDSNSHNNGNLSNCIEILKKMYHQIERNSKSKPQLSWSQKLSLTSLCDYWIYQGDWEAGSNCYDNVLLETFQEGDIIPSSLPMERLESITIASIDHLPLVCWGLDFSFKDTLSCLIFVQYIHYSFHTLLNTADAVKTMRVLDRLKVYFQTKDFTDGDVESSLVLFPSSLFAVSQYLSGLSSNQRHDSKSGGNVVTLACSLLQSGDISSHDRFKQLYNVLCSSASETSIPANLVPSSEYGIVVSLLGVGAVKQTAIFLRNQYSYKNNMNTFNYDQMIQNALEEFINIHVRSESILDLSTLIMTSTNLKAAFLLQTIPDKWFVESWVLLDTFLQLCAPVVLTTSDTREPLLLRRLMNVRLQTMQSYCNSTGACKFNKDINPIGVRGLFLLAYQGTGQDLRLELDMPTVSTYNQYHGADWEIPQQFFQMFGNNDYSLVNNPVNRKAKGDVYVYENAEQGRRIVHIGFLSSFFRRHSVGRLLAPLIGALSDDMGAHNHGMSCNNRNIRRVKVDINTKSDNNTDILLCIHVIAIDGLNADTLDPQTTGKKDDIRIKLKKSNAIWHSFTSQSANVVANQIKTLDLDVLVFGDIFLDSTTAYLSTYRMAANQIAFWGHPYSSGVATIDYFISSIYFEEKLISKGPTSAKFRQNQFVEQLVLFNTLGFAFEPDENVNTMNTNFNDNLDAIDLEVKEERLQYLCWLTSRSHDIQGHSLKHMIDCSEHKKDTTVYTCLQTLMKMHPSFDEVIFRLLERKHDAIIVLLRSPTQVVWQRALQSRLLRRVGKTIAKRIYLVNQMPHHDYRRAVCGGDVTLDPFPFGGGVTMIDSLACDPPTRFVTSSQLQTVHGLASGFAQFLNLSQSMTVNTINDYVNLVINTTVSTSTVDQKDENKNKIEEIELEKIVLDRRHRLFEKNLVHNEWKKFIKTLII